MKSVMVAIPTYTGTIHAETAQALYSELCESLLKGWKFQIRFHPGNAIISRARNFMVANFMESDATDLVFVDHDVYWKSGDLLKLCEYEGDIVCGSYPYRKDPIEFPVSWLPNKELWANEQGLLEVAGAATGFMRISRKAIETMMALRPDLAYEECAAEGKTAYAFFDFLREGGQYFGEDYTFCRTARECGLHVFIDPEIELNHIGYKTFTGRMGDWLRERMK